MPWFDHYDWSDLASPYASQLDVVADNRLLLPFDVDGTPYNVYFNEDMGVLTASCVLSEAREFPLDEKKAIENSWRGS